MQQKASNVYVGNLPYSTTEQALEELFSQHGQVVGLNIIRDKETNRPKGFAFVEYADKQQAEDAIEKLNGQEFGGRTLNVSMAKSRPGTGGGGGGRPGNGPRRGNGGGGRHHSQHRRRGPHDQDGGGHSER